MRSGPESRRGSLRGALQKSRRKRDRSRPNQVSEPSKDVKNGANSILAPIAQLPRIGSQMQEVRGSNPTGRVTGKSTASLWRNKHPAMKGLWPPEHHAGHSIQTKKTPPSQTNRRVANSKACRFKSARSHVRTSAASPHAKNPQDYESRVYIFVGIRFVQGRSSPYEQESA